MSATRGFARLAARLTLGLATFIVSLGLMEMGLRPFYHPSATPYEHRLPHPTFGWSLEPNASYIYEGLGFRVPVSYNARGLPAPNLRHSLSA